MTPAIVAETVDGYITREQIGKSVAYIVYKHGAVAATRVATIGTGLTNAFERAMERLAGLAK